MNVKSKFSLIFLQDHLAICIIFRWDFHINLQDHELRCIIVYK